MTKRVRWTPAMVNVLEENYGQMPNKELALLIGCTHKAVQSKAQTLGLQCPNENWWIKAEVEYLTDHYYATPQNILMRKLRRPWSSILQKARLLGLRRKHYQHMTEFEKTGVYPDVCSKTMERLRQINIQSLENIRKYGTWDLSRLPTTSKRNNHASRC